MTQAERARHVIVASQSARFAGWPANGGLWAWGDELLVAYYTGPFEEQKGHNIAHPIENTLARSRDAGETWTLESWRLESPAGYGGITFSESLEFTDPNLIVRVTATGYHNNKNPKGGFFLSRDKGVHWKGSYEFPGLFEAPELAGSECTARTSYIATGTGSCLFFMSARDLQGRWASDRAFCAETRDGGLSFRFVSWIVPPSDPYRAVMPSVARTESGKLVAAVRRRLLEGGEDCWIDCYLSADEGRNWEFTSRIGETGVWNGNPPALSSLSDGRLCCVYGNRSCGLMLTCTSQDEGATWQEELVLRDDFLPDSFGDMDFGYPRAIQLPDGCMIAIYYWATRELPEHHIAATSWDPVSL